MTVTHASPAVQKFCEIWKDSLAFVLGQLGVGSPSVSVIGQPAAAVTSSLESGNNVIVRFSGGGILRGGLEIIAERPVAVQLAQLLMSEPLDPATPFNESHHDAFTEFLRQVSGPVVTAWKQEAGGDTELNFQAAEKTPLASPLNAALRLSGEKLSELSLSMLLSSELCEALSTPIAQEPIPDASAPIAPDATPPPPAESPQPSSLGASPSNLDLLLDVELQATIRFGHHEMLLRDIFGLMPGAVVELDQLVNEPAELRVAGRLIARGEVVVVDGNFGLQVTEVASPGQRAELLQL
jgi:flagellar motor switch protein FliN/FliY